MPNKRVLPNPFAFLLSKIRFLKVLPVFAAASRPSVGRCLADLTNLPFVPVVASFRFSTNLVGLPRVAYF